MNNEVKKVLFIVNKYAGTGYQPQVEGHILDACETQAVECSIEFTQGRGHATELAQAAIEKGFANVIAVGGDGTVNEVAAGLIHSPVIMGILPRGSGNGLARHLGIPMKITHGLTALFKSQPLDIDTFTINGKLSLNVSGLGFDGHVANLFGKNSKRGLLGYVNITIREFFQFKEFEAEIIIDTKKMVRNTFIIAIANSSQYGNDARIAPAASVCDQLLNITLLKKVPPYRLDFVYDFFRGKIDASAYCEVMEGKNIFISAKSPISFHIDGEPCGAATSFDIRINPGSLKMLVPQAQV